MLVSWRNCGLAYLYNNVFILYKEGWILGVVVVEFLVCRGGVLGLVSGNYFLSF